MPRYRVSVLVTLHYDVFVDAVSEEEAERKTEDMEFSEMREISDSVEFMAVEVERADPTSSEL